MKKIICLLLALCLLAGCCLAAAEESFPLGKPYTNPNLYDSFPECPGPEDNYYIYACYDLFVNATADAVKKPSKPEDRGEDFLAGQFLELCRNPEYTDTETEILQILYRLASDTEKRKQEGFALLMSRVNRVKAVRTAEELTGLMQEKGFLPAPSFFMCNVQKSESAPNLVVMKIAKKNMLDYLPMPDDATAEELAKGPELDTETPRRLLLLMQYSEEEAGRIISGLEQYDNFFAPAPLDWVDGPCVSLKQILENSLPLYAVLSGTGGVKEGAEAQRFYEIDPYGLAAFTEYYTDENLETLKAIVALSLCEYANTYLNLEAFAVGTFHAADAGAQKELIREVRNIASVPASQAYINHYCPEEKWAVASDLFDDIREAMRKRILASSWLSEESRKKALKKLDNLALGQIIPPGGNFDCGALLEGIRGCSNLMDAAAYCERFDRQCRMRFAGEAMDRTNPYVNETYGILATGGQYIPQLNLFNIGAPALNGDYCDFSSTAALYGSLGFHIAHEVSHGYDILGARSDVTGAAPLFTEGDNKYFTDLSLKISAQLDRIGTGNGVMLPGEQVTYETMADLTGMTLMMDLAKQEENFDYAACFRAAARFFYDYEPGDDNHPDALGHVDTHPPYYVRINFTVAHFDEFYEAFPSVTEGTPMYIAPEDRILPW